MGSRIRKSFKAGPVRITASKSGVSYSAGVKGTRVAKRVDGRVQTTLSAPGTGLSHTSTSPRKQAATSRRRAASRQQAMPSPGERSSVLPQPPPPGTRPLPFKGYLATVTLHPDRIQIDRKAMGRINGNRSISISWHQLAAVDFLDPSRLINGHVHFATAADPRGLTPTGGGDHMAAVARNPHAIMFTWRQRAAYGQLRGMLTANSVAPSAEMPSTAPSSDNADMPQPSVADELAKLYALYQQGALTHAEFEQAKAWLIGQ